MISTRRAAASAVLAALLFAGVGCSSSADDVTITTTTKADQGKVSVDLDGGDSPTVEYTDKDGTKTEFGSKLPDGWPADLTPPSTISVVSSSIAAGEDGATELFVSAESTTPFAPLYDAVKAQLTAAGYEVQSDLVAEQGDFAGVLAKKGTTTANVTVTAGTGGKQATVLYTVTLAK